MKKILSLVMVSSLVLSLGLTAFAGGGDPEPEPDPDPDPVVYVDYSQVEIKKEVNLINEDAINPGETFNFTIGSGIVVEGNVTGAPEFAEKEFQIIVGQDDPGGSANISLPNFEHVGIYKYPISEDEGNTAGMDYDSAQYYLVVTVINDGSGGFMRVLTLTDGNNVKRDAFINDFSAGSLIVEKEITGNYAVFSDTFEVTVVLDAGEQDLQEGPIAIVGAVPGSGSVAKKTDGTVEVKFKVTDKSIVSIDNIPFGVSYSVSENSGEYEQDIEGGSGVIAEFSQDVFITNNLDKEITTGVNLDNLPYILILGGVLLAGLGLLIRRRLSVNS